MSESFELRCARAEELEAVADAVSRAFTTPDHPRRFLTEYPHLWLPEEAPHYHLCLHGKQVAGCVGLYPQTVRLAGVEFRAAGVGQVSTVPEYRGQGVMSRLLNEVTAELDSGKYDFAWLSGDRQRYGRYGWSKGDRTLHVQTSARYLPAPPDASEVTPLDPARDADHIAQAIAASSFAVDMGPREIQLRLTGPKYVGWRYANAWVIASSHRSLPTVVLADGPEEPILRILAHLVRRAEQTGENGGKPNVRLLIETPPGDSLLTRIAHRCGEDFVTQHVRSFRICNLAGFLSKAARIIENRVAGGSDELSLRNSQTGDQVRILCQEGKIIIDDQVGSDPVSMTTAELSEVIMSPWPLDVTMPSVAPGSPIRRLLRPPMHVGGFFDV